jgi:hypothetical protein
MKMQDQKYNPKELKNAFLNFEKVIKDKMNDYMTRDINELPNLPGYVYVVLIFKITWLLVLFQEQWNDKLDN